MHEIIWTPKGLVIVEVKYKLSSGQIQTALQPFWLMDIAQYSPDDGTLTK